MVHAPTVYDVAHEAGLTTAQVDWVAIYRAKTITWQFPELPNPDGEIERDLISAGAVTSGTVTNLWTTAAQAWQDRSGPPPQKTFSKNPKPNLLLFHLLTGDDTNHEYGPMSHASLTAFAFLDNQVKQIVEIPPRAHRTSRQRYTLDRF